VRRRPRQGSGGIKEAKVGQWRDRAGEEEGTYMHIANLKK
jgi:hypothetical protein